MPQQPPSILLMMCDQLTAGVLSCYGGPVPTPNLDRLAADGVLFTNATCPTPFCSPSRASLITGMVPHRHGIVYNVNVRDYPAIGGPATEEGIKDRDTTTEKLLSETGYDTHHYGKWHLLDDDLPYYPDTFGEHHEYATGAADVFRGVRTRPRNEWMDWYDWAMPVTVSGQLRKAVDALGDRWSDKPHAEFIVKMGRLDLPAEQVFDVQVADRTIEAIHSAKPDVPFMITCSFNYPHDPNVVPSPYYDMIDPDDIRLPANYECRETRFEGDWSRQIVRDLGETGAREFLRIYYASVRLIDDQVGRVLAALDTTGRASNTIVLFTSDHGDMAGGHGMVWKSTASFYEEVVRVPLLIRYPGRLPPHHTGIAAALTDVMPTLLDWVGIAAPEGIDGRSLAPYVDGRSSPADAPSYTFAERVRPNPEHTRTVGPATTGAFMVRGQGTKYFRYPNGEEFLFDLAADPGETVNLATEPAWTERKSGLKQALEEWLTRTGWPPSSIATTHAAPDRGPGPTGTTR